MDKRLTKQIIIGSAVGIATILLIWLFVYLIIPSATCTDKKQNQGETGIDCGGPCSPCVTLFDPETKWTKFFQVSPQSVDVVAEVYNKNYSNGAENIPYTFTLYDAANQKISEKSGEFYIMPGQSRFVSEIGIYVPHTPSRVEFKSGPANWLDAGTVLGIENNVQLLNQDPATKTDNLGNFKYSSNILNKSFYDFDTIEIDLVAYDSANNPIAVGKTSINTVHSNEKRFFESSWPQISLQAQPQRFDVRAVTDLFDPKNFLNKQASPYGL